MSSSKSQQLSGMSEEQISEVLSKLHLLIPELRRYRGRFNKVSASRVLQEACNYIRNLHGEVDDLSHRLTQLLTSTNNNSVQVDTIIKNLIMSG